jgi:hypothetical protein
MKSTPEESLDCKSNVKLVAVLLSETLEASVRTEPKAGACAVTIKDALTFAVGE